MNRATAAARSCRFSFRLAGCLNNLVSDINRCERLLFSRRFHGLGFQGAASSCSGPIWATFRSQDLYPSSASVIHPRRDIAACASTISTPQDVHADPIRISENGAAKVPFVIDAAEAARQVAASGLSEEAFLAQLVKPTLPLARPVMSKFHVGAVGLGVSGRIFRGVNLEFPGLPLQQSIHAEQFMITNAMLHGERALKAIAVSAAPCGHCRQFMCELPDSGKLKILIVDSHAEESTLEQLLPHR